MLQRQPCVRACAHARVCVSTQAMLWARPLCRRRAIKDLSAAAAANPVRATALPHTVIRPYKRDEA
eukprot:COSAG02_NODE_48668_length_332_cov_0.665236_1_plen_65_part_10